MVQKTLLLLVRDEDVAVVGDTSSHPMESYPPPRWRYPLLSLRSDSINLAARFQFLARFEGSLLGTPMLGLRLCRGVSVESSAIEA